MGEICYQTEQIVIPRILEENTKTKMSSSVSNLEIFRISTCGCLSVDDGIGMDLWGRWRRRVVAHGLIRWSGGRAYRPLVCRNRCVADRLRRHTQTRLTPAQIAERPPLAAGRRDSAVCPRARLHAGAGHRR